MSSIEYDPVTGLPKQAVPSGNSLTNPYSFTPNTSGAPGTTGATGTVGATGTPGTPGGLPSWSQFLADDPYWKQLNADLSAQGISDEASAKAAAQRGFIQFGEVPADLTGQAASWIDPTTRELAAANTTAGLSRVARLNKQNTDQIRKIKNSLAARNLLRSGELGHQLKENQGQYEQAQYDSRSQLTDYLQGITSGLAAAQRQAAQSRAAGLSQVVTNYYGQPQGAPVSGYPAPAQPPAAPPPAPSAPAYPPNTDPWQWQLPQSRPAVAPDPWQRRFG